MGRRISLATVQLDVTPAPLSERLGRAETLITQAAQTGAHLVVLPEVFNTGYAYRNENFALAEPLDGPTAQWMKQISARLVEAAHIFAADGRQLAALRSEQGDSFALAEVNLPAERPEPHTPQPKPPVPWLVYLISDKLLTMVSAGTYARGTQNLKSKQG